MSILGLTKVKRSEYPAYLGVKQVMSEKDDRIHKWI